MDWFDAIKTHAPEIILRNEPLRTATAHEHPRDAVSELIKNSIAVLENPDFKIKKRGKPYRPEVCFRDSEMVGWVSVTLTYCREPLRFPDGNVAMEMQKQNAVKVLAAMSDAVKARHFDSQLEEIKRQRSVKLATARKNKNNKQHSVAAYPEAVSII